MAKVKIELDVKGMSCQHCVKSIKTALGEIDGIFDVKVDLSEEKVAVEYDDHFVQVETMKEAIEEQGYEVQS